MRWITQTGTQTSTRISITPGSVARLVKHGLLAFYYGDPGEAGAALARGRARQ